MKPTFLHKFAPGLLALAASLVAGDALAMSLQNCTATPSRFVVSGAEATDARAGLVWKRCLEGETWSGTACTGTATTFTHQAALDHARLNSGSAGWRLPDVKELLFSLIDRSCVYPARDDTAFPSTPGISVPVWASTPYVQASTRAWRVYRDDAETASVDRTFGARIYLVRTAP